ncbi:hypothetical protein ACFPTO_12935 [Paraburkholderia denitrificans]|uniref:Uncharacterized protein n=1 Tax=Paraburkholderia denitrificans TaxID=694025 RepID=A0ABW0J9H7_9BURK
MTSLMASWIGRFTVTEARVKQAFTPQHSETTRGCHYLCGGWIGLSGRGLSLFDPLLVWLKQIYFALDFQGNSLTVTISVFGLFLTCGWLQN